MTRRTILLAPGVTLCAGCAGAIGGAGTAPKFTARTLDGEIFTNETFQGKVLLLQFWTTWCRYCRADQAAVDTLAREFEDKGLAVLAVNLGETRRKVKDYLDQSPRACKVVLSSDTNLAAALEAKSFPYYVVIDRRGNIAGEQKGAGGERALRALLARAGLR